MKVDKIAPIPKQYRKQSEALIHEIGRLSDKLWIYIAELGDNMEIETNDCIVKITKR